MSSSSSNKPTDDAHQGSGSHAVSSCKDCIEFLIDYLEGTLPPAKRAEFELHLELCPPCHRYLTQYQATIKMGQAALEREATKNPPPEALIRAIMATMKGQKPQQSSQQKPKGDCGCGCDC